MLTHILLAHILRSGDRFGSMILNAFFYADVLRRFFTQLVLFAHYLTALASPVPCPLPSVGCLELKFLPSEIACTYNSCRRRSQRVRILGDCRRSFRGPPAATATNSLLYWQRFFFFWHRSESSEKHAGWTCGRFPFFLGYFWCVAIRLG